MVARITTRAAALAVCAWLAGCTSIPVGTMLKMRSFGKEDFAAIEPREILVTILLPDGYELNVDKTRLVAEIEAKEKSFYTGFGLRVQSVRNASIEPGFFGRESVQHKEYLLHLSEEGAKKFNEARSAALAAPGKKQVRFEVSFSFAQIPENAEFARFTIDLQLSKEEGFFRLVDDAKVRFKDAEA